MTAYCPLHKVQTSSVRQKPMVANLHVQMSLSRSLCYSVITSLSNYLFTCLSPLVSVLPEMEMVSLFCITVPSMVSVTSISVPLLDGQMKSTTDTFIYFVILSNSNFVKWIQEAFLNLTLKVFHNYSQFACPNFLFLLSKNSQSNLFSVS